MTWLPGSRRSRESQITSTSVHHPHLKENKYGGLVSFLKGSTVLCHQVMVFPLGVEPGDVLAFRLLTNRWGFTAEGAGTSPGVLHPCFLGGPKWWMSPMRLDRLHSILLLWESSWLREMDWCLVWRWALRFFSIWRERGPAYLVVHSRLEAILSIYSIPIHSVAFCAMHTLCHCHVIL